MNGRTERTKLTGLDYFGKMMAAISHEIKNSLAIINENAGLIEDLTLMAKKGTPLDPERIGTIAGRITGQIQRADTRVKKMNRLAHSVDDPVTEIDVAETLAFTVELGEKSLLALGIKVEVAPLEKPVIINTNEFLFMNLMWETLGYATHGVERGETITIAIRKNGNGVEFVFSPFDEGSSTLAGDGKELSWDRAVAETLGATILPLAETRELVLKLPEFVEAV
jgi:signal transduction histidine kinase